MTSMSSAAHSVAASDEVSDAHGIFQNLFVAYPDALLVADTGGRIVLANRGAAQLLGYSVEELVGLEVDELVPDSVRPLHAQYRDAYGRAPRARPMGTQMNLVAKRRDGTEVMVEIALSPLCSHGEPFVVAAIRDIGSYPRVKEALRRARYSEHVAQFGRVAVDERTSSRLIQDLPAIAIEALQVEVALVYWLEPDHQSFRLVSRVGLDELAWEPATPNTAATLVGHVGASTGSTVVDDYRIEKRFPDTGRLVDAGLRSGLFVPLLDRGHTVGAVAVHSRQPQRFGDDEVRFIDALSNLLITTVQRAQSDEALQHAQRLESVGQLTGGIAHDFNNLLMIIQGNLQVLEELPSVSCDAQAPQLVSAANRAAKRGSELTRKLLAFSRRQVLQPGEVDVGAMVESLADMLRRTVDQRIEIDVDLPAPCPAIVVDSGQLESALLNVAINARDAMPDGGRLTFSAGPCSWLPTEVRADLGDAALSDERYAFIAVADSGNGMSAEVRQRAFEPFFTTKEAGRGTGLGLSTVYGFVKQSRGAISLRSAPGAGTVIELYFPRATEAAEPAFETFVADAGRLQGLRVLLVEDDADVRAVALAFLRALGCEATAAASAEDAGAILERQSDYDLLVTDIALGTGMRGTDFAADVIRRMPHIGVLLVSGFSAELLDADRNAPAGWELLQKPYGREALAAAITRVVSPR